MTREEKRREDEQPFRDAGYPAGPVSMGHGRELPGRPGQDCSGSKDGSHRHVAVSCIQSIEHFVCQNEGCDDEWWD